MKLALFGYGGHSKEVSRQIGGSFSYFVDDGYENEYAKPISQFNPNEYELMITISNPTERERVVKSLPKNTSFFTFIHPTAQIMGRNVQIGEGTFIGANSILTEDIVIGKHSILNRAVQIGHDTIVGDYFTSMPNSVISGNVFFGERGFMGTNSTIIEKIRITDDVVLGANGVIVKDINESGTYIGVPAKKIK